MTCDHLAMELRSIRPRGTFRARATRDGHALERDGATYALVNLLSGHDDPAGGRIVEIMFEDGIWMLATDADLEGLE